jgi:hypothetical protein
VEHAPIRSAAPRASGARAANDRFIRRIIRLLLRCAVRRAEDKVVHEVATCAPG